MTEQEEDRVMPDTAQTIALEELRLQRDYLLGLIIKQRIPDGRGHAKRTAAREGLLVEAMRRDPETDSIREVGKR